jgi:hypothetical protein
MIPALRNRFNASYTPEQYTRLLKLLEERSGVPVEFRVAETPVFVPRSMLDGMANEGAKLAESLIGDTDYLAAARRAIPHGYGVAAETAHPGFLTADFALVRDGAGNLVPRLVEIQAFPSVFGYQAILCEGYREAYGLADGLGCFLGGVDEAGYWKLLAKTVTCDHDPESVVLTEVDPLHQKTRPDFEITAERLGISVVDIAQIEPVGKRLHYRDSKGKLKPITRIYNRAIADELIAKKVRLPFRLSDDWDVEWAGHPNWYFLISKFSIPYLSEPARNFPVVPPAVFLDDFLAGPGRERLEAQGVPLAKEIGAGTIYSELLLKPLFSFAGKGIQFEPTRELLESIPAEQRSGYLLQQRMRFEHTIETPHGPTQAEFRILYLWPDDGELTPVLSLVRLGRGKMMGVDHNKNQEWVGASAAFYPHEMSTRPASDGTKGASTASRNMESK